MFLLVFEQSWQKVYQIFPPVFPAVAAVSFVVNVFESTCIELCAEIVVEFLNKVVFTASYVVERRRIGELPL